MKTNPVIDAILCRRSIRAFEQQPVSKEDLETIVTCGQWAPSARNRQGWMFVVLDNANLVAELAHVVAQELDEESYAMYNAQALIIVAHKKEVEEAQLDDGCALENMFLAAHSLGIGSVWLNQLSGICEAPAVREKLSSLGVLPDYEVFGVCALGYSASPGKAHERKSSVVWA